jgi:hypothetical protein
MAGGLQNSWVNGPRQPEASTGQTIPASVKGITVYIAAWDDRFMNYLGISSAVCVIVAACCWITYKYS